MKVGKHHSRCAAGIDSDPGMQPGLRATGLELPSGHGRNQRVVRAGAREAGDPRTRGPGQAAHRSRPASGRPANGHLGSIPGTSLGPRVPAVGLVYRCAPCRRRGTLARLRKRPDSTAQHVAPVASGHVNLRLTAAHSYVRAILSLLRGLRRRQALWTVVSWCSGWEPFPEGEPTGCDGGMGVHGETTPRLWGTR